jgi:hypothetical protein
MTTNNQHGHGYYICWVFMIPWMLMLVLCAPFAFILALADRAWNGQD